MKKTKTGSSDKPVQESKSTKNPKKTPVTDAEPIIQEVSVVDTLLTKHVGSETQKGIIPSKTAPVSPSSKKRRTADMAKHISKKKKKSKMIISSESTTDEDETIPETPEANLQKYTSTPSQTAVIPPEGSVAKSLSEEARTSDILVNVSHTDTNVIMGEYDSKKDDQGKPSTITSETFISFPPQITPIILITSTTDSPTFENIIKHPITSLFSSQSTSPPTTTSPIQESIFMETENESESFGGTFENLEFDEDEADFPDHMFMGMKQFKILNTKLNSILQLHVDLGRAKRIVVSRDIKFFFEENYPYSNIKHKSDATNDQDPFEFDATIYDDPELSVAPQLHHVVDVPATIATEHKEAYQTLPSESMDNYDTTVNPHDSDEQQDTFVQQRTRPKILPKRYEVC
ncbi:unnamed protein product [Lactuca saligna]|uniref:Uncharacterized protein n=1 Tax=Lactuca saligna TaxID=75948 RepID=A0AA35YUQ5_LACSI|nr:unnamed protein product [Lactuca saligna]